MISQEKLRKLSPLLCVVGLAIIAYVCFSTGGTYWTQLSDGHQTLMTRASAYSRDPSQVYSKCLWNNPACTNWVLSKLSGDGVPLVGAIGSILFGSVLAITPLWARKKVKRAYTARFSEAEEVENISFGDWLHNEKLRYAFVIGFFHRLPGHDEQPYRDRVIRGESTPELSRKLVALPTGYGGRKELGHAVTTGMTRSGKSLTLFTQLALWHGSCVALDIKGELFETTSGIRSQRGPTYVLSSEGRGHRFDAIGEFLQLKNGAVTAAKIILKPDKETRPEFANRAAQALAAIFMAAKDQGKEPLRLAREVIAEGGVRAFYAEIACSENDDVRFMANLFLATEGVGEDRKFNEKMVERALSDRYLQSAWAVLTTKLAPLLSEDILWTFSGSDFKASDIMEKPCSVYLDFPEATLEATARVYDLLVQGLTYGAARFVDETRKRHGQRWFPPHPLFFALDETHRAPIANLEGLLSTAAGRGISISLYLQSIDQLEEYGKKEALSILNNCSVENFYTTNSQDVARYISERCHKVSVDSSSRSRVINRFGKPVSQSVSSTIRDVFTIDEVYLLGGEDRKMFISFITGKRPVLLKRIAYYETELGKLIQDHPPSRVPEMEVVKKAVALPPEAAPQSGASAHPAKDHFL